MKVFSTTILDYFIKDVSQLNFEGQFKSRMLVLVGLTAFIVTGLIGVAGVFGYHEEKLTIVLAALFAICLMLLKNRGNIHLVAAMFLIGGIVMTTVNISTTGYIYSYNYKWYLVIMLFLNFFFPKWTMAYILLTCILQIYIYSITPEVSDVFPSRTSYLLDNLASTIIMYAILLVFEKHNTRQNNRIDKQNTKLVAQKNELEQSNELLKKRSNELLRSNRELEYFAYVASHDLKVPLNNIISFSKLLEKELKDFEEPKAHKYFGFIKKGSHRMYRLIEDILEYSQSSIKAEEGKSIDLNVLVTDIQASISEYLSERNAEVIVKNTLPEINANYAKIHLLFKNLIENAIKYNKSKAPHVQITSQKQNSFYIFSFTDNGIGIEDIHHSKIFNMFKRLHRYDEYEGTGLGLSLCKKTIEAMGGKIELESQVGVGTTFLLFLPDNLFVTQEAV